jgi:tRNA pseudouridine55 synthase
MGRRNRKGRDISSWLVVDKPKGVASSAVVNKAKWAFDGRCCMDPHSTDIGGGLPS